MPQGLPYKLRRVFALQAALAIAAVVACLSISTMFARDLLATRWVHTEAARFWSGRADDPGHPPPWTTAVNGYFVSDGGDPSVAGVPPDFITAGPGLHRLGGAGASQRLLVEDGPGGRLYLRITFRLTDTVSRWSLLISSLLAAAAIAAVSWLSYRTARRMVLPVTAMATEVARWDPRQPDLDAIEPARLPGQVGREVQLLGGAIRGLAERSQAFIRRERDFTREASHELRTPLTVVRVAADMLHRDPGLPPRMARSLERVRVAAQDMEAVVDALLILAREDGPGEGEVFDARSVAADAVEAGRALLAALPEPRPVRIELVARADPKLRGSSRALRTILDQLVRNACSFTHEGHIEVRIGAEHVEVGDTGVGMAQDVLERAFEPFYRADQYVGGRGLGLAVVRRLAGHFGWSVDIDSAPGEGTRVRIGFRPVTGE